MPPNVKRLADQFARSDRGEFTVATTHTQARYALPPVVAEFKKEFPLVRLILHQGSPPEIATMLLDGEADIAIATEALIDSPTISSPIPIIPGITALSCRVTIRSPACRRSPWKPSPSFRSSPIDEGFTGRGHIDERFAGAGLAPDIVMAALDADVIKAYVELGMGVGLMASMAFVPERDKPPRLLDCSHLFEEQTSRIAVRRGRYLRGFAYRFITLCSPALTEDLVRRDAAAGNQG